MFRNDYEIELEDTISLALFLLENNETEKSKEVLKKCNDMVNYDYDKNFKSVVGV